MMDQAKLKALLDALALGGQGGDEMPPLDQVFEEILQGSQAQSGAMPNEQGLFDTLFPAVQTAPKRAAQPASDHTPHVLSAIRAHGGDYNLAPLHKIREHLTSKGVADRAQQDAAITQARRAGTVSGSALEGRHGIDPAHLAASLPDPGNEGGKIGYLSLKPQHLAEGGVVGGLSALLSGVKGAWTTGRALEHKHLESRFLEQQGLAGAIADQQASTPEQAAATKKRLALGDTISRWTSWYGLHGLMDALAGPIAGGAAAKASYYLPAASMGYTAFQLLKEGLAGRNPTALLKAARAKQTATQVGGGEGQTPHLATGGGVPDHPGQPIDWRQQGTDTQPAMLTPGEEVVNRASAEANRGLLERINAAHGPMRPEPGLVGGLNLGADHPTTAAGQVGTFPGVQHLATGGAAGAGGIVPQYLAGGGPFGSGTPGSAGPVQTPVPSAGTGPVPVRIVAPLPLPVKLSGVGTPGGTGGGGGGGQQSVGFVGAMGDQLHRTLTGLQAFGGAFKTIDGGAKLAFGTLSAGITGAAAASPTLFRDLTGSTHLFAASLAQLSVVHIVQISHAFQDAGKAIRSLDPEIKKQVGTWAMYTAGGLGAYVALSKAAGLISGTLIPMLGAFKTASVFLLTNPFGLAAAGLAVLAATNPGALAPLGEGLMQLGKAALGTVPSMETVNKLVVAVAGVAESILVPALKVVLDTATGLINGLKDLGQWLGVTNEGMAKAGLAAAILASPLGRVLAVGIPLVEMLNKLHPALGGIGVAAVIAGPKLYALWGVMAAHPLLATGIAIAGVTVALLKLGGAFATVGDQITSASSKIAELQAKLAELRDGEKVKFETVASILSPEEQKAFSLAKTKEEERKILDQALAQAQARREGMGYGKGTPEQIERAGIGIRGILGGEIKPEEITKEDREATSAWFRKNTGGSLIPGGQGVWDQSVRTIKRRTMIAQHLMESGLGGVESYEAVDNLLKGEGDGVQHIFKNHDKFAARKMLGQEKIGEADIEKLVAAISLPATKNHARIEILKKALAGGVTEPSTEVPSASGPGGPKIPGAVTLPSLGAAVNTLGLGGLFDKLLGTKFGASMSGSDGRNDYIHSYQQVMPATQVAPADIRVMAQQSHLNSDPYERLALQIDQKTQEMKEESARNTGSIVQAVKALFGRGR